jgi:murein DD-endopeptidase MepM/ murein hydrolase activator NlpD
MEGFGSVEFTAKILEANVTTTEATPTTPQTEQFADYIVTVGEQGSIERALVSIGYPLQRSKLVAAYLAPKLMGSDLDVGDYLRIGVIQRSDKIEVVRASAYRGAKHLATVAIDDDGRFVSAAEPEAVDAIANSTALDEPIKRVGAAARVYDGIYRAALSYGMTMEMATEMVGCLAPAIDFLAPVKPTDRIDAFFSVEEKAASFGTPSQLLFVSAHLGDVDTRLYRYRDPLTGKSGYYDQDGKSIQQALLRNPVPSASSNSNSSYGMRQHPVLGFARMHTGVDYAAASGTPIVSSGAGVVVRAGWDTGGYGNQTVIRHSGGYVSSYSHQSAIAEGLKPGRRVKQGEVIGYVGSTGMATGAHLHYELSVNGNRVNPLRARLPVGQSLQGTVLTNFLKERQKIDALIASPLARAPSNT